MTLALVTGASSGIGFQLASQLAERGYDIVGVGASSRITELGSRIEVPDPDENDYDISVSPMPPVARSSGSGAGTKPRRLG